MLAVAQLNSVQILMTFQLRSPHIRLSFDVDSADGFVFCMCNIIFAIWISIDRKFDVILNEACLC